MTNPLKDPYAIGYTSICEDFDVLNRHFSKIFSLDVVLSLITFIFQTLAFNDSNWQTPLVYSTHYFVYRVMNLITLSWFCSIGQYPDIYLLHVLI
jgi:hypothetical protein